MPDLDTELMQRFIQKGDRDAIGQLFTRQAPEAYRIARILLKDQGAAEDAVQEAFSRLIRKASAYNPGRPFLPWLRSLVTHASLNQIRARRRRTAHEMAASGPERLQEEPAMPLIAAETRAALQAEIERLPDELRLPLLLHYQAGCSYAETAGALDCPEGTVATRLATARERLKTALATAGVILAAGMSLESATAAAAPPPGPVPTSLAQALRTMAIGVPLPGASRGKLPRKSLLYGGAAVLLLGVMIVRGLKPSPLPPSSPPPASPSRGMSQAPPPQPPSPTPASPAPAPESNHQAAFAPGAHPAQLSGRVLQYKTNLPVPNASIFLYIDNLNYSRFPTEGLPVTKDDFSWDDFLSVCESLKAGGFERRLYGGGFDTQLFMFRKARADAEGRFSFEDVPPGIPFHLKAGEAGSPSEGHPIGHNVRVAPLEAHERRRHDLFLPRQGGLMLRLRRLDGNPMGSATLTLTDYPDRGPSRTHELSPQPGSPDGSFILEQRALDKPNYFFENEKTFSPFPGVDTTYEICHPEFLLATGRVADLPFEDGRYVLDLVLESGRRVAGILLGPDGAPCAGEVSLIPKDGSAPKYADADASGLFAIQGLPLETPLDVHVYSETGFLPPTEIPAGGSLRGITLRLEPGMNVSGRLENAQGQPVRHSEILARGAKGSYLFYLMTSTDADGRFTLMLPPRGEVIFEAEKEDSWLHKGQGQRILLQQIVQDTGDLILRFPAR